MRRTAFSRSFSITTREMLSSLEPCAIATTFTFAFPRAVNTRALHRDEAEAAERRGRLYDAAVLFGVVRDRRSAIRWRESVEDADGDAGLDRGEHRPRVDDLRAEVAQLRGLRIRHRVKRLRALHDARICAHHAAHVGVNPKIVCLRHRGEHRSRIVGSTT